MNSRDTVNKVDKMWTAGFADAYFWPLLSDGKIFEPFKRIFAVTVSSKN